MKHKLSAILMAFMLTTPAASTVSGQLHAVNAAKQQVTQTMNAGIVSSGEVTSTEPVR